MKYAFVLIAAALSGCSAFILGRMFYRRVLRLREQRGGQRMKVDEALSDPVFLFTALLSICGLAGVLVSPWMVPPCLVLSFLAVRKAPEYLSKRRSEQRRQSCEKDLDMLCDIVAMGIDAGLSFDAALELYCQRFKGPLAQEMWEAYVQWTHGIVSRREALRALGDRLESPAIKRFAQGVSQAIEHGSPVVGTLRRLAVDLRQARKVGIERQVARAPVKMLVPTGVCILPAMMLVVMGPMILLFMEM